MRIQPSLLTLIALATSGILPLMAQQPPEVATVWPPPPEEARIAYAGMVHSERDLGKKRGFFSRISGALLGTGDAVTLVNRPYDVHVDIEGRIWMTNGMTSGLWVFDREAKEARLVIPEGAAAVGKPMGLDGDDAGTLFVADARSKRIVAMDGEGGFLSAYGGRDVLLNPVDVALSPGADRLYVSDSYLHQVLVFDRSTGEVVHRIGRMEGDIADALLRQGQEAPPELVDASHAPGQRSSGPSDVYENRGAEPGQFRYPSFVAVGSDGTVYVTDQMNFRVQQFDADGNFQRIIGRLGDVPGSFARPKGVAVDSDGHVYVVDGAFNNVQIFDREGRLLLAFANFGSGDGELWLPLGLAVDSHDRIYVADRYNNRIQLYQYLTAPAGETEGSGPERTEPGK